MSKDADTPLRLAKALRDTLEPLSFAPPVTHVYNPLEYAWRPHEQYLRCYGRGEREIVLFGMNPGPWGMAQTGVPFGEVHMVRDWLGIEARVGKPAREHPKRPIEGFACRRSEVSGARLWGFLRETFETPQRLFERLFVANYCPLVFMEASGRNRTPDKLPPAEREALLAACDRALRDLIAYYRPRCVVGVGKFAEQRARAALAGLDLRIGGILHPSPANPLANRDWAGEARRGLRALGIEL